MVGHVDINNFYASCERVFQPYLYKYPLIVLSNNDGCVISRSNEAKNIGVKMGVPYFEIKDLIRKYQIKIRSSNYTLYGNMSERVMSILSCYTPNVEIYSIDECFLDLAGFNNLHDYGKQIVEHIDQWIHLPVSVGIAPTKTLAKVATRFAKKYKGYGSVCAIDTEEKRIKALQKTAIRDIWGIGRAYQKKLNAMGVCTAYDFTRLSCAWTRKDMTIVGEKMWKELHGIPCLDLELIQPGKKEICTSRSFSRQTSDYNYVREAVSTYADTCAKKLRQQKGLANAVMVFIHTNNFNSTLPQYGHNIVVKFPVATDDTLEIIHFARKGLDLIFKENYQYKKAGVILLDITTNDCVMTHLFYNHIDREKRKRLMKTYDTINAHDKVLMTSSQGQGKTIRMEQKFLSGRYTTNINEIIELNCNY